MMYHDISTISPLAFALINNLADLTYPWGPIVEAKQTQSDRVKPAMAWLGYEANKRVIFWGIYEEIAEVCIDISRCIYIFCYIPCNSIYYSISFHVIPLCHTASCTWTKRITSSRGAEDPKQLKNPPGQSLQHHCPHQPVAIPIIGGVFYLLCLIWGEKNTTMPNAIV